MNPATLARLKAELAILLESYPDLIADEQLRRDMLEGETDFFETMATLIREEVDAKAIIKACTYATEKYDSRAQAATRRLNRTREAAKRLMEIAGEKSVKTPVGSFSVSANPPSVVVTDMSVVPDQFIRVHREPDKDAIGRALKDGKDVPGCRLGNGGVKLTVRIA